MNWYYFILYTVLLLAVAHYSGWKLARKVSLQESTQFMAFLVSEEIITKPQMLSTIHLFNENPDLVEDSISRFVIKNGA